MNNGDDIGRTPQDARWRQSFEERDALTKIKSGAIAALISAIITTGFAVAGLFVSTETAAGKYGYLLDPWVFVDGALMLALAAMIYFRKSFSAALFLLVYFLLAKILMIIETASFQGGFLSLVFVYFFWQGVVGTRELRQLRASVPARRGGKTLFLRIFGGIAAVLFFLAFALGSLTTMKVIPGSVMIEGDDIPQKYVATLRELGVLEDGEVIEIFYSAGVLSIAEDGNMMTGKRVISYEQTDEEFFAESALFEDISHILIAEDGEGADDALLEVVRNDGSSFYLWMPEEEEAHLVFMDVLRRKLAALDDAILSVGGD